MRNPNLVAFEAIFAFILVLVLIVTINNVIFEWPALAQSSGNETQVWIDRENNVKIFFTYSPENPVINAPTQLKFTANNLLTGSHLKNLLAMVVIIGNSSAHDKITIIKFANITAPNGIFSIIYQFPELGIYQVITRVSSTNPSLLALASFKVIVTLETSFLNIIITGVVILVIFGGVAYLAIIVKKKAKKKILG